MIEITNKSHLKFVQGVRRKNKKKGDKMKVEIMEIFPNLGDCPKEFFNNLILALSLIHI